MYSKTVFTVAALSAVASAFDLPDNLRQIYDNHIVRPSQAPKKNPLTWLTLNAFAAVW